MCVCIDNYYGYCCCSVGLCKKDSYCGSMAIVTIGCMHSAIFDDFNSYLIIGLIDLQQAMDLEELWRNSPNLMCVPRFRCWLGKRMAVVMKTLMQNCARNCQRAKKDGGIRKSVVFIPIIDYSLRKLSNKIVRFRILKLSCLIERCLISV
ncbi:AAEL007428-PA [Aedes aegypti]|uniref:AAEL007428-PA n=1 Tax=Aedes aegypti TaxID=7159 RepID=Q0IEZ6_AEDAE|nr:AAEL007428-PA [Aedes aegypti]